jgi:hypothetical protein
VSRVAVRNVQFGTYFGTWLLPPGAAVGKLLTDTCSPRKAGKDGVTPEILVVSAEQVSGDRRARFPPRLGGRCRFTRVFASAADCALHREELPLVGDALHVVQATTGECVIRADDQVPHGPRGENFA